MEFRITQLLLNLVATQQCLMQCSFEVSCIPFYLKGTYHLCWSMLKIVLRCYNRRGGGAMQHCHSQEIMSLKVSNRDDMVQQQAQF